MIFHLITKHPVAVNSLDHIYPCGTSRDNSVNYMFNKKLYDLFPNQKIYIMDLGCSGGGMVKSFLDAGHIAIGLEGSDYSLLHQRAEWATIPDNLFTCDITEPFIVHDGNEKPFRFDVITAWEVLEHIEEKDIVGLIENIHSHLKSGGLFIGSTTDMDWVENGVEYHRTKKPFQWWVDLFGEYQFYHNTKMEEHFGGDWVRAVQDNFVFVKLGA